MMDYVAKARERLCKQDEKGRWLCMCGCGQPLDEDERVAIKSCETRLVAERSKHAHEEQLASWKKWVQQRQAQGLATLPPWDFARVDSLTFSKCVHPRFATAAKRWRPPSGNLVLVGPSGCGKTSTVVALFHRLSAEAVAALAPLERIKVSEIDAINNYRFISAHDIAKARRENSLGNDEAELVRTAKRAKVLALDEFGFESKHDEVLFEILDERYRHGRVTIATSGRSPKELEERYGSGFWRRLMHGGALIEAWIEKGAKWTATG